MLGDFNHITPVSSDEIPSYVSLDQVTFLALKVHRQKDKCNLVNARDLSGGQILNQGVLCRHSSSDPSSSLT